MSSLAALRITLASGAAPATSVAAGGSLTSPIGRKTPYAVTDLNNTFYLGAPNVINSIATGVWSDVNTWDCTCVPASDDNVVINNTHNVSTDGANVANTLTINSGGTLTAATNSLTVGGGTTGIVNNGTVLLSGATVTLGATGGDSKSFVNNAGSAFNMSGGTLNVNGYLHFLSSANFTQSAGTINIDGNGTSSVATGSPLLGIGLVLANTYTGTLALTGGTIRIVDPHAAAVTGTDIALMYYSATSRNIPATHTFEFGDGTSTAAGGSTSAFALNTSQAAGDLSLGTVTVNGGAGTNRFVSQPFDMGMVGNLTINSGGEFRVIIGNVVHVAGNITNNGTLTTAGTLALQTFTSGATSAVTAVQTISGSGTFRNAATSPSGSFYGLTFNNTNATGVTISTNNLSVVTNLTFTAGRVALGSNTFQIGVGLTPATLAVTAGGFLDGTVTRAFGNSTLTINTLATQFPFISATGQNRSAYLGTTTLTTGGTLSIKYTDGAGINTVPAFNDNGVGISKVSNAYWTVTAGTLVPTGSTAQLGFRGDGITTLLLVADARATRATSASNGTAANQGTIANPVAIKTGLATADFSGDYYFSAPGTITSIATGIWDATTTWDCGCIPGAGDAVIINTGHNVTLSGANAALSLQINSTGALTGAGSNSLTVSGALTNNGTITGNGNAITIAAGVTNGGTINTTGSTITVGTNITNNGTINVNGGTLNAIASTATLTQGNPSAINISAGTFNFGPAGGHNRLFSLAAGNTLNITGGTFNFNGNVAMAAGTFNMTGGAFNIDGNSNSIVSSVLVSTVIFTIDGTVTGTVNGGTITIVDPNFNNATVQTFSFTGTTARNWTGNTLRLGDGVSTDASSAARGFEIDCFISSGRLTLGDVVVNGGAGANRFVTTANNTSNGTFITNLIINAGSELRNTTATNFYVNGNITNNGTLTVINTLSLLTATGGANANAQTISGSGVFRNATSSPTASFTNLAINNTNATGITVNVNNLRVSGTLTLTAGKIVLGSNTFILGVSVGTPGTLSYTDGGFTSGTFTRWFGTGTITIGGATNRFPFISGTNNRSAFFGTSGATSGGSVSVNYNDASGTSTVTAFTDLGVSISRRSNANWVVTNTMTLGASTAQLRLQGQGIFTVVPNFLDMRITSGTGLAAGTSIAGTGSNGNPAGNKTTMTSGDLTNTFYVGIPSVINSIATGNWSDPLTWDCNCVPTSGDIVFINNTHNVSTDGANTSGNLTINAGGTLTAASNSLTVSGNVTDNGDLLITGGTVTIGPAGGGNRTLLVSDANVGLLSITSGTLNVNGNVIIENTDALFEMTGGAFNIDPNDGTLAGSVASGTTTLYVGSWTTNVTGGTITIVDPPFTGTGASFEYWSSLDQDWTGNTLRLGDGVSTNPSTATYGFSVNTYSSTGTTILGTVLVNGGSGANRFTSPASTTLDEFNTNNLTINAGSEFRAVGGMSDAVVNTNVTNNGTLTISTADILVLAVYPGTPSPNTQTISGSGVFRDAVSSPVGNIGNLSIDNSNATGVNINVNNLSVSGIFTLVGGKINLGSNTFSLGTSATNPGTLTYTAGGFTGGTFRRWYNTSAITIGNGTFTGLYPFVSGTNNRSFHVGTSGALTAGGSINVTYADVAGTTAVSITDGASVTLRSNSSWAVAQSGLNLGSSTILTRIQGTGVGTVTDFTATRIVNASTIAPGTSVAGTGSNAAPAANKTAYTAANLAGTYYFGIGIILCPAPSALTAANITTISADLNWTVGGTETAWDIEWMLSSATPTGTPNVTGTTTRPYPLGGLTAATSYKYYVRAACGGGNGNSTWVGPFTFTTAVPAATNDLICNATTLTVNTQAAFSSYSNAGSTTDATPSVASTCQSNITGDVWFRAVAPAEGTMAVYFRQTTASPALSDVVLHTYTSSNNTCSGTLTLALCNDDSGPTTLPFAYLTGLTPGNTVFIRVSSYGSTTTTIGSFDIAVTPYIEWTGATSTTWATPSNWLSDNDGVNGTPGTTSHVLIPNVANDPINLAGAGINGLRVLPGATVTNNGGNLTIRSFLVSDNAQFLGPNLVVMTGSTAQTISGNGSTFTNLRINNTAGVTVASGANMQTITEMLELRNGTLNPNGNITIRSSATTQAYIDDFSSGNTGSVTGSLRVERYITNGPNGYRYIGPPVATTQGGSTLALSAMSGFVVSGILGQLIPLPTCSPNNSASNSPYGTFMYWQENSNYGSPACRQAGWWFQTSGTMTVGRGYGAKLGGGNKVTYTGVPNTGTISNTSCTHTNVFGTALNGWNLVSNPFPSSIGISSVSGDGSTTNDMPAGFDGQIQFYQTSGPFTGTYVTYNVGTLAAPIALGQGFWVRVSSVGATPAFTLGAGHRTTNDATYFNSPVQHHLSVDVAGNGFMDKTEINFLPEAQTGFDFYDGYKWDSRSEQPTLYTKNGSDNMSINSLPSLQETMVVPMGMKPGTSGSFTFTFNDVATFPQTSMIYLEDIALGTMTDLRANNSYQFTMNNGDNTDRFMLHFQPGLQAEVADQDCDNAGSIELTQPAPTVWSTYEVRGTDGNVYAQGANLTGTVTISNLPAQEYVVTVTHPSGYSAQEYITVNGSSPVNATINASATNVMIDEMVTLAATASNATEYTWNFGDGNTATGSANVVHAYDAAGTYTVTLTAASNVCNDVATKTIVVGNTTGITTEETGLTVNGVGTQVVVEFTNWGSGKANITMYDMLG
ncbi:MAG: PKD domain-containing protein [Sphingobacteriales bacterium JAD_PAG50586_3]|nr:MAG: PKD domain-containing protein [Sphingobacteriales bacterium JAD_PAG50586_3]